MWTIYTTHLAIDPLWDARLYNFGCDDDLFHMCRLTLDRDEILSHLLFGDVVMILF